MDHRELVAGKLNLVATLISKMQSKQCVVETTTMIAIVKHFPNHFPIPTVRVTKNSVRMTWKLFPPFKIDLIVTKDDTQLSYSYPGGSTVNDVSVDEISDQILHIFATGEMHESIVVMKTFSEARADVEVFLADLIRGSDNPDTAAYWKSKMLIGDIPDDWSVPTIGVDKNFTSVMFEWYDLHLSIGVSKDGYKVMYTNGIESNFTECQTMKEALKIMIARKESYDRYKSND